MMDWGAVLVRKNVFGIFQRIGRSFMLPIAVLPIAGLFLGVGSSLTNPVTIASLHLESVLGQGTFIHNALTLLMTVGEVLFDNLPLIFAASVSLGMAKKAKEVAVLSSIIAFFVMHSTINGLLTLNGIVENNQIVGHVMEGTLTYVCGQMSLEMGVFGGIIVGLGVSYLHNRFYQIQLPDFLSFFEGERFIPIISTIVYIGVGCVMYLVWPTIQSGIFALGKVIAESGYIGTFVYGIIKRALVPFGLHHVFYMPFYQTAIGGTMVVNGTLVSGAQNIFFAQLADPTLTHFSVDATKYFSGEFMIMLFGLPGAALAMYRCAKEESKNVVKGLLLSAALTSILTGITEPIEFTFLFVAPMLFGVHVFLAGTAFMVGHMMKVTIGFTFSSSLIDFVVFGVLQGNEKTRWILIVIVGIIYFFFYYFSFSFLIKKFDLKTPGREDNHKLTIFKRRENDYSFDKSYIDPQVQLIIRGLGGRNNFTDLDCCITRLRATLVESSSVSEALLKQAGAAAVVLQGKAIQIIFGPKASSLKTKIDDYIANVPETYDEEEKTMSYQQNVIELGSLVDGEVMPIEESKDHMFAKKVMGDGVIIRPKNGIVVSPCEATVTMIYPTKHAIGLKLENGIEILLHFGVNTVDLRGQGFEVFVEVNQKVKKGDLLWKADLSYIKENIVDESLVVIFTTLPDSASLEKEYGYKNKGEAFVKIHY